MARLNSFRTSKCLNHLIVFVFVTVSVCAGFLQVPGEKEREFAAANIWQQGTPWEI